MSAPPESSKQGKGSEQTEPPLLPRLPRGLDRDCWSRGRLPAGRRLRSPPAARLRRDLIGIRTRGSRREALEARSSQSEPPIQRQPGHQAPSPQGREPWRPQRWPRPEIEPGTRTLREWPRSKRPSQWRYQRPAIRQRRALRQCGRRSHRESSQLQAQKRLPPRAQRLKGQGI